MDKHRIKLKLSLCALECLHTFVGRLEMDKKVYGQKCCFSFEGGAKNRNIEGHIVAGNSVIIIQYDRVINMWPEPVFLDIYIGFELDYKLPEWTGFIWDIM